MGMGRPCSGWLDREEEEGKGLLADVPLNFTRDCSVEQNNILH